VRRGSEPWGAVGIQTGLGAAGLEWAVVNVLVRQAARARSTTVARVVEAIEHRCGERPAAVLADYLRRCSTIGRGVRARLIPLGPGGVAITGRAVTARLDGSLVVERDDAVRIAVLPQSLGLLEEA
jgi:BirA family biotin operon repressor/biotin-[acetyl-CoA-carboxylase] ligase